MYKNSNFLVVNVWLKNNSYMLIKVAIGSPHHP